MAGLEADTPPDLGPRIPSRVRRLMASRKCTIFKCGFRLGLKGLICRRRSRAAGSRGDLVVEQNRKVVSRRKSHVSRPFPPSPSPPHPRLLRGPRASATNLLPSRAPARAPAAGLATRAPEELLVSGVPPRLLHPSPPASRAAAERVPPLPAARPCTPARSRSGPPAPQRRLLLLFLSGRCSLVGAVGPA